MTHLAVHFNNAQQYNSAKQWFDSESDFSCDRSVDALCMLLFPEQNLDALERALEQELSAAGFTDFYFTAESY